MKVKKFLISFSFTILFGVLSIGSLILYIFGKSNYDLFQTIITGISSIFFMVLTIKGNYYDSYYIAYNQKYFLNDINIFEDSITIKEKKIIRYKKFLKDKVTKSTYSLVYNKTLDLHFIVYELKNNFQLITIKNTGFTHTGLYFDETDRLLNTDVLIEKIGIKQLEGVNYIKKYTSNDEKSILFIHKDDNSFRVTEYTYSINFALKILDVYKEMLPHWYKEYNQAYFNFDNYHEAEIFAVRRLNSINEEYTLNGKPLQYFVLPRQKIGTEYHEFQTGDKKDVYWDKTSILLHEDIMEKHKMGEFFSRVIPNYDYFGKSLVNETTWNTILNQVIYENEMVKVIIDELRLWAEESIYESGCFTILGI
ncbi:hypothetical protein [Acholeplasma laidlawii]|uniref:Uncharacterized protein n=3 Tax=Acholeplasma laidlawii TaxID=2148 RepID=A0A553IHI2_ACHLA|nr:hypothetical protein [Acholeplasma laidlawii]TRX99648.1 hypothetical protein FNV44_00995 [Acholeplasma laidlawii]